MGTGFLDLLARFAGPPLRPPGAVAEGEFLRRCIKCGKCAQVCPYGSIRPGHVTDGRLFGTPVISAREMPCYLCMKCPPVCPTGALDTALTDMRDVRMGIAVIDEIRCLAYNGIICRACFERCPLYRQGILMRDELYPEVQPDACVGCGVCESVCIAEGGAIRVQPCEHRGDGRGRGTGAGRGARPHAEAHP